MNRKKAIGLLVLVVLVATWSAASIVLLDRMDVYASAAKLNPVKQIKLMTEVLSIIKNNYVEEVDLSELIDGAIEGMFDELDPHSNYVGAKKREQMAERFRGNFEGIGIAYDIRNGILTVVSPIEGSPSDRLGIRAGDQILKIDGVSAIGIKNEEVKMKLRGPKGSTVTVSVRRAGEPELLEFAIVRDKIPLHSVLYSFMIRPGKGFASYRLV